MKRPKEWPNPPMDLVGIKQAKNELARDIGRFVAEFEKRTGTIVEEILIERINVALPALPKEYEQGDTKIKAVIP